MNSYIVQLLSISASLLKVSGNPITFPQFDVPQSGAGNQLLGEDISFPQSTCRTISGAAPDKPCIFPFIHKGVTHYDCQWYEYQENFDGEHWCSTKVNETGHHISGNLYWGVCGKKCPHTTDLLRLQICLENDMMPLYGTDNCYPLFEQGPCDSGEWFVLNSAINGTLLPYAHCEKTPDCDVFTLKTAFEGPECIPCDKNEGLIPIFDANDEYLGCQDTKGYTTLESEIDEYVDGGNESQENETTISPNDALSIRNDLIDGLNFCDEGFGPDTNGECVRVYKLKPAKNDRGIEEREIEKSKRPKDLKKYLQLLYSFDF